MVGFKKARRALAKKAAEDKSAGTYSTRVMTPEEAPAEARDMVPPVETWIERFRRNQGGGQGGGGNS